MNDHPPDEDSACVLVTDIPNLSPSIRAVFQEYAIVSITQAHVFLRELTEHVDMRAQLGLEADEVDEAILQTEPRVAMAAGPVFDYRTIPCGISLDGLPAHFGPAPATPAVDDEGESNA